MKSIDEFLAAPDRIWCDRMSANISRFDCLRWQKIKPAGVFSGHGSFLPDHEFARWVTCHNCEQGRKVMQESTDQSYTKSTKVCSACGQEKDLADFYRNPNGSPLSYCKTCHNKRTAERKRKKKAYEEDKRLPSPKIEDHIGILKRRQVTLDFSDHNDIYLRLVQIAEEEVRSVENYILFLCVSKVRADETNA